MRLLAILFAAAALSGCGNACQTFCGTLADYAAECGTTWSDADISACEDAFADASADDLKSCRTFGDPAVLRREWTCEDVNLYRDAGGGTDTDL